MICSSSYSFGSFTSASKFASHAEGSGSWANGGMSHAQGIFTVANKEVATFIDGSSNRPAMLIDKGQANNDAGGQTITRMEMQMI